MVEMKKDEIEALQWKEKGNLAFKEKRYNAAIQNYTQSLECKLDPIVLGNRAQAEINAGLPILAQMDCSAAIGMDGKFAKCYYRRAQALKSLGLLQQAYKDAEKCATLSSDAAVLALKKELQNKKNVAVLEVDSIERDEFLVADEEFQIIPIICEGSCATVTQEEESTSTKMLPRHPANFSDFAADVNYLEDSPHLLAQYFLKIDENCYHQLFDDLINETQTLKILKSLDKVLTSESPKNLKTEIAQKLLKISEVGRFDLIIMLMGAEEKKAISSICSKLSTEDARLLLNKYLD